MSNPVHQRKQCSECKADKPPEGGIDLGRGRWVCVKCWQNKVRRQK
jgi:hypothetical protein